MAERVQRGGKLVAAVERAYDDLRRVWPELPDVVVCIASGTGGGEARHGHYAAMAWNDDADAIDELFVAGERLGDGAEAVLETLLHESAHALGIVRGTPTTSRQGRYHNKTFVAIAEELGLLCLELPPYGWAHTELTDATLARFATTTARLQKALDTSRLPSDMRVVKKSSNLLRLECPCGRIIRASEAVALEAIIRCEACDAPFVAEVSAESPGQLATRLARGDDDAEPPKLVWPWEKG